MQFFQASCSKITHKTNLRKGIFHENWYFCHFLAKNGKNYPCTKVFVLIFTHFFNKSKSVENEKVQFSQMIKVYQKNFHLSKEKINFWPFLWFFQNHKNSQKIIFSFERWTFFWHTIIIWGNITFSFWTLFKHGQNHFGHTYFGPSSPTFLPLMVKKCPKYSCMAKVW